ncbi:MAG: hypothetical protein Kow0091_25220 [Geminocystis sp.]
MYLQFITKKTEKINLFNLIAISLNLSNISTIINKTLINKYYGVDLTALVENEIFNKD